MKNSAETLVKRNVRRKYWRETVDLKSIPREVLRECLSCQEVRPCRFTSSFTQTGKPEYRSRCQDCYREYLRKWAKRTRPRRSTVALDRKYLRKKRCVEYLGSKCCLCGYDRCIKAMTFHHRDPETKIFEVSSKLDYAWSALVSELDKCDLLCFNCHMEEHCEIDQNRRVTLGYPKSQGCLPHSQEQEN